MLSALPLWPTDGNFDVFQVCSNMYEVERKGCNGPHIGWKFKANAQLKDRDRQQQFNKTEVTI